MEADGAPADVLDRYQKVIMACEAAYAEGQLAMHSDPTPIRLSESAQAAALQFTFRHGDGSAEVLNVDLLDASRRSINLIETGQKIHLRVRIVFHEDLADPVYGFIIRNRHGIHLYGTNSKVQGLRSGRIKRGTTVEVTFSFECWLAPDLYSISIAVHSITAVSFDWLDGVLFFRVLSDIPVEGVANLNATVTVEPVTDWAVATRD
jgi:hypothetical protein